MFMYFFETNLFMVVENDLGFTAFKIIILFPCTFND
jgi:hypothetical protein